MIGTYFYLPNALFRAAIEGHRTSLDVLREGISKAKDSHEKRIANYLQQIQDWSEEEQSEWLEANYEIYIYEDIVPNITWQSLLISVFGSFEYHLAYLCSQIARFLAKSIRSFIKPEFHSSLEKMLQPKDSYIRNSKVFLGDLFPTTNNVFNEHREFLDIISSIRNYIAHNGGILSDRSSRNRGKAGCVSRFCERHDGIEISRVGRIIVKPEFLDFSLTTVWEIFTQIHSIVLKQARFVSEEVELEGK